MGRERGERQGDRDWIDDDDMMMMKCPFHWWRKMQQPEETTDLRQVTDKLSLSHMQGSSSRSPLLPI